MSAGERLARNGPRALRAGLLAFATAQLWVAVVATPWLSVHSDAAHAHPLGTGAHVHAFTDLFAAGPVDAPVRRVDVDLGAAVAAAAGPALGVPAAPPSVVHGARGPPAIS